MEKDRLSILEKVEQGEISIEEAESVLKQAAEEVEEPIEQPEEELKTVDYHENTPEPKLEERRDETYAPTRRERKLALAEQFQDWQPQMMIGAVEENAEPRHWPWSDKRWQWMWQDFDHPVYVSHSIDISPESELNVVAYQGDLFIRGWDEPTLKINGAVFDVRIGQEDNIVRVASSTGQMQIWVPNDIARLTASVDPGDMWISNVSADIDVYSRSGDLGCEHISGSVRAKVNGGDVRLMGINGSIYANVIRGNSEVRNISSTDVTLKATEGNIWLSLDSVSSGNFRCENDKGDINLLTNGELSCELLVEATMGGRLSPVILPWQRLLERSEGKLHGILKDGGASISLITQSGRIYIQEPWTNKFPMPSSG
jgi:DUF4097 and DUF4098 domain-containing protein YvlB